MMHSKIILAIIAALLFGATIPIPNTGASAPRGMHQRQVLESGEVKRSQPGGCMPLPESPMDTGQDVAMNTHRLDVPGSPPKLAAAYPPHTRPMEFGDRLAVAEWRPEYARTIFSLKEER